MDCVVASFLEMTCPGRSAVDPGPRYARPEYRLRDALLSRGLYDDLHHQPMGPGSAEQRKSAAPRPGHERSYSRGAMRPSFAAIMTLEK